MPNLSPQDLWWVPPLAAIGGFIIKLLEWWDRRLARRPKPNDNEPPTEASEVRLPRAGKKRKRRERASRRSGRNGVGPVA
jgi:hypothetical protein